MINNIKAAKDSSSKLLHCKVSENKHVMEVSYPMLFDQSLHVNKMDGSTVTFYCHYVQTQVQSQLNCPLRWQCLWEQSDDIDSNEKTDPRAQTNTAIAMDSSTATALGSAHNGNKK